MSPTEWGQNRGYSIINFTILRIVRPIKLQHVQLVNVSSAHGSNPSLLEPVWLLKFAQIWCSYCFSGVCDDDGQMEVTQCVQATVQIANITWRVANCYFTERELNLSCIPINATFSILSVVVLFVYIRISKQDLSVCIAVYALCTLCSLLCPPYRHWLYSVCRQPSKWPPSKSSVQFRKHYENRPVHANCWWTPRLCYWNSVCHGESACVCTLASMWVQCHVTTQGRGRSRLHTYVHT